MPGYRSLSTAFTGTAADSAREAETRRRDGDPHSAVILLEEALAASSQLSAELPGWLCGRLAALYRTLGRYDDEVALLERYRESQVSEEARSRYDARLSKARTIAERKRRSESGALSSVRTVLTKPRRRSTPANGTARVAASPAPVQPDLSNECVLLLSELLGEPMSPDFESRLDLVLTQYCAAARAKEVPVEQLVQGLRDASRGALRTHVTEKEAGERYSTALVRLLAIYFGE